MPRWLSFFVQMITIWEFRAKNQLKETFIVKRWMVMARKFPVGAY